MQIRILKVRIAFPQLDVAKPYKEQAPRYQAKFIVEPKSDNVKLIEKAMLAAATAKWSEKGAAVLKKLVEDHRTAFSKREYSSQKTDKVYPGFEGMYCLSAGNRQDEQPTIYDQYANKIADPVKIKQLIYRGCYTHALVTFWAQDNDFGRRINCQMNGVMFAGDGQRLSGGSNEASEKDFEDLAAKPEDAMDEEDSVI
tara:strand:+ start:915 stop:1508 length:594 start_codon:yes stop_codon:yes gene_type:complete